MKTTKLFTLTAFLISAGIFLLGGCQEGAIAPVANGGELSDQEQIQKLIEEDETIQSFEPNYNEEEAMSIAGSGLAKAIFPIKVGHRMKLVNKTIDIEVFEDKDSAFAAVTCTFEGILYIAASYDELDNTDSDVVDTLIEKPFTTFVTHNVIFKKRDDWGMHNGNGNGGDMPDHPGGSNGQGPHEGDGNGQYGNDIGDKRGVFGDLYRRTWKIVAISLTEGGTGSSNIFINKLTLTLPDGEEIVVESPNDYFMYRMPGRNRQVPSFSQHESILIKVELQSTYSDTDFVCLTFGAQKGLRYNRAKKVMELVSEAFDGTLYTRVYQQEWMSMSDRGPKHAIVRAVPKQVVFDDETDVEVNSWGVPYIVK